MTELGREELLLRIGSTCLLVVTVAVFVFGAGAALLGDDGLLRADGVALAGMGLFGALMVWIPFRRRERWAWWALWYLPVFWLAHLVGGLPPGKDHVHQVVFIVLSVVGLLVPMRTFFAEEPATP
jgi:hypothetical protein